MRKIVQIRNTHAALYRDIGMSVVLARWTEFRRAFRVEHRSISDLNFLVFLELGFSADCLRICLCRNFLRLFLQ